MGRVKPTAVDVFIDRFAITHRIVVRGARRDGAIPGPRESKKLVISGPAAKELLIWIRAKMY
jgi:hypothetical protein